jgi:hypothetical protein
MKPLELVELLVVVLVAWLIFVGAPLVLFWRIGRLRGRYDPG